MNTSEAGESFRVLALIAAQQKSRKFCTLTLEPFKEAVGMAIQRKKSEAT